MFSFRLFSQACLKTKPPMTPTPRQSDLIELLRAQGPQSIEALAERFNVTLQTVRRDVTRLAEAETRKTL